MDSKYMPDRSSFLPVSPEDVLQRGWQEVYIVCVTGDAYVDHPSFGISLTARVLEAEGLRLCFMAEYFLPDLSCLEPLDCPYPVRVLHQRDFAPLYRAEWSNALCERRKELDVLGLGAYDGETLVGFAACSADCEGMWQIGVDVLPGYRRRGDRKSTRLNTSH